MSVEAHLDQLATKHSSLEARIDRELKSPAPDTLRLSTLKKQKLAIKDRIGALGG